MNLTEMAADLENQIARGTKPWMRIAVAILLVLGTGALIWWQLTSPVQIQKRNAKASQQFGEALERAGIQTQAGPSK